MQIDDLLSKLDQSKGEVENIREEKDQEIMILNEELDNAMRQLADKQKVRQLPYYRDK